MGTVGQGKENSNTLENDNDFEGDEIDDDLVFVPVPQRAFNVPTAPIHFDEIDDEEMRRFAESFEQEQQETKADENDSLDVDDEFCQNYQEKMQTPTKSLQMENNKRKKPCIEDLDALLNENDDDDDDDEEDDHENQMEAQEQMSPVFKKKP